MAANKRAVEMCEMSKKGEKTYDWLFGDSFEILDVVVLMLLKSDKQIVLNHILIVTHLFPFCLLPQVILNLKSITHVNKDILNTILKHTSLR